MERSQGLTSRRLLATGLSVLALGGLAPATKAQPDWVYDGEAGFVLSNIEYALAKDAEETGACPDGMTGGYTDMGEVFVNAPDLSRKEGEKEQDYIRRVFGVAFSDASIKNLCHNPELGKPNPTFRTVIGPKIATYGIDLDGVNSSSEGKPVPGSCAHDDFIGMNGEQGIDNQFYRVVGCSKSFQSTGQSNSFDTVMLTGAWGILVTLSGIDDIHNDDSVEVGFYANADPIQLSPTREPIAYATYAIEQDARYRAKTRGRIVDGVLTTEPTDMRFHWIVNSIHLERPLEDAVAQLTIGEDGHLEGYLAGYTTVEDMYNLKYSFFRGVDATGEPSPKRLRAGSAIGQASVLGHTCEGAWYAMWELADALPDPETGKCTALSTQYRINAIPAFVVDVETGSVNQELDEARSDGY